MNSDHENKCIFVSLTSKNEENKVTLFFLLDILYLRCASYFVIGDLILDIRSYIKISQEAFSSVI